MFFVIDIYWRLRIGIELALLTFVRDGRHSMVDTDSAANHFGAPQSVNETRGTFPFVAIRVCHSHCCESMVRRAIMTTVDALPGESNGQIISSIINLVCPQCGGRMSEFQCEGRCCRNWLAEWEWANFVTGSSKSQRHRHCARFVR
jgi:hypothetical protein